MIWNNLPLNIISLIKNYFSENEKRSLMNLICKSWKTALIHSSMIEINNIRTTKQLNNIMKNVCIRSITFLDIKCIYNAKLIYNLINIISTLTNLQNLVLEYTNITNKSLFHIFNIKSLQSLTLSACKYLTINGYHHLPKFNLQSLNIRSIKIDGGGLANISSIETLETLEICNLNIHDKDYIFLSKLKNLRELHIRYISNLTDDALQYLSNLIMIEKINIFECNNITDKGIYYLPINALKELTIQGPLEFTGITFRNLAKLELLKQLHIGRTGITNDGLKYIQLNCPSLQYLDLTECFNFSDDGLYHISNIQSLMYLNFHSNYITNQELEYLSKLENLIQLSLRQCIKITDDGIIYLANISTLKIIDLFACELITDIGMHNLSKINNLTHLTIACCEQITDIGIEYLSNIKTLQYINTIGCDKITKNK